jgi:hypothetical protein
VIVNYGDFYFGKDDGRTTVMYAPDPDSKELVHICYVEPGDSLADVIARVWTHRDAPPSVVDAVKGSR